jgi:isoquinoline 1-oxidoreductase beta subunit
MLTGGSTSVRAFEPRLREAGAAARALLSMAAAERWDVDWETLDTHAGFVVNGSDRLRFGVLAEAAAGMALPEHLPVRGGNRNRLSGQSLPRIDLPSKIDGSAQFAGDIRLPDMVYASVRAGPIGSSRLVRIDRAAADAIPGVLAVFEEERWAGAVATNWWAANRAVEAMRPVFSTNGPLVSSGSIDQALADALSSDEGVRFVDEGEVDAALSGGALFRAHYSVGPAPNAPLETLVATARLTGDRLEIWAPTQAPGLARAAAARATGIAPAQVTLYPTFVGSGYGRKLETAAITQAAIMAAQMKRPVQLVWSRIEETMQDSFRPPARGEMVARMDGSGRIAAWRARIAAPSATAATIARLRGAARDESADEASAVAGARPPYVIPAVAVEHLPADTGLATGIWRSVAHSYTAFFSECFVDELARKAMMEPLSFRMQMLADNPRLARCLSTAAALGGWDGGAAGSGMGIAAHSAFGSHVATLVEVSVDKAQRVRVDRAVIAVDCGRVINPQIVRQLVEGGTIYGIAGATGAPVSFDRGLSQARNLGDLRLPRLADSPEVTVEIIASDEPPGGVTELAVPTAAPAIANAVFALTGQRLRALPLVLGSGR